jgi:hypothetical protein
VAHLSASGTLPSTNRLHLAIGLTLRDAPGLEAFLTRLYDPASPDFRRYLTPARFADRFGPSEPDYQAVIAFAQTNHLSVTATHGNRLLLDVSGTVADIQRAFHITLRVYRHPVEARDFFAPDTEPTVAAGLPIADISGLNDYGRPHPKSRVIFPGTAAASTTTKSGTGSGGTYQGNDFRAAYLPGVTLTGAGQTVGLYEQDGYYASDITAYESAAGLTNVPLQTVLLDGFNGVPESENGNEEASLDIEMAACMAPALAKIVVFEATNGTPNDILNAMAASNQISQLSCSWAFPLGPSTTTDNIFKEMAAQGQSFFNASGDSDAFTPGANSVNGVDNPLLNNAPSSNPWATQVGGTTLTTTGPGGAWSSETVWNEGLYQGSYSGSSGGVSTYYAIPVWQTNVSMTANGGSTVGRNIPDVALVAANVYGKFGNGKSGTFTGTSCAAPLWAGLAALINEQSLAAGRSTVGFLNPALYTLGRSTNYGASFHDITTGNNFWPSSPSNYKAVTGYDLCTGWGTPAGAGLINALAGSTDSLVVEPGAGFTATGMVGGPFNTNAAAFTLTNLGTNPLNWVAGGLPAWLTVTPANGTLAHNSKQLVTASLTACADALPAGIYPASIMFSNATSGLAQSHLFTLQVGQSLVQNGGFETGDFTDWTLVGDGGTTNGTFNAVESLAGYYTNVVHAGDYGLLLGDTNPATLSQNLATQPGQGYFLSFWLENPTKGPRQQFWVNWNTNSSGANQIYYLTNPPVFSWTNLTFLLTATRTNTGLQFGAENPTNYFGLDDISVTPVPAPSFVAASRATSSLRLTWYAVAGVNYQVFYSTNLASTNWLALGTNTATDVTLTITNNPGADRQRFYRIERLPY